MASPRVPVTPMQQGRVRPITITPGSRVLDVSKMTPPSSTNGGGMGNSPLSDDDGGSIWKRLRDAGFDQESIRRRDKAALIAYIAKLEAEIFDLEHNMGLLILEKKDYASNREEARLSVESSEVSHLRDRAALSAALSESRKREENLKKSLGIEKECVANLEKALHEIRTECAEVKVSAESKMAEARSMIEDAQNKYFDADAKLRAAETHEDDARRCERAAGRKLQEVEAREDDLRRRMVSFKSDCEAKEKELMLERQSLVERQKVINEAQNKLVDGQALLNQREADILSKSQAIRRAEKELEAEKENFAADRKALMEQKSTLELNIASLAEREKDLDEKETLLNKKEQELIVSQERFAVEEHNEVQKLIAEQEIVLRRKKDEFDAELVAKQRFAEEEIEKKRRDWELKELDIKEREDLVMEREQELEVQSRVIADKGKDLTVRIKALEERETLLNTSEVELELTKTHLQKEKEEIDQAKIDLDKSLSSLEEEKKQIAEEAKRLELLKSETSELFILETKLKEEIDMIRAQKLQLEAEAERLKVEKAKFETEWEVIDEKREELRREEERINAERIAVTKFLKDERDGLNAEKEALREQYRQDLEALSLDREAFRTESQRERSEWFSKFQQERKDFLLDIECTKKELDDCVNKKREDVESYLKEKEKSFEEEMKKEQGYISSLKEDLLKEQEMVASELKKLEAEKLQIKLDREQRDKAWAELQSLIEELQLQRLKLKEQRELLHADREKIYSQIEQLKELEDLKDDSDKIVVPVAPQLCTNATPQLHIGLPELETGQKVTLVEDRQNKESGSPSSVSWLKRCASLIFKNTPDENPSKQMETALSSEFEDGKLGSVGKDMMGINDRFDFRERVGQSAEGSEEPKVIHEVPSKDEDIAEIPDVEASIDVLDSCTPTFDTHAGRKRRVADLFEPTDVVHPGDGDISKKRRQLDTDSLDYFQDLTPLCVESRQPTIVEDQYIVSSSTLAERNKEDVAHLLDKVEGGSSLFPKDADVGDHHQTDVQQSQVDISGRADNGAVKCVIMEQTIIEEVLIVDGGETVKSHEPQEAATTDLNELGHSDTPDAKLNKAEAVKERGRKRSKAKEKM